MNGATFKKVKEDFTVRINHNPQAARPTPTKQETDEIYKKILGEFKSLQIDTLKVDPLGKLQECVSNATQLTYGHPKISAAVICKNEEENILACLESVSPAVDEIVVVDTGSADGTMTVLLGLATHPQIGKKLKVKQSEWRDDFAAARNFAQSECTGDIILWFDADDRMPIESAEYIRGIVQNPLSITVNHTTKNKIIQNQAFYAFALQNVDNGAITDQWEQTRMYPNNPEIKWRGAIHETILASCKELDLVEIKCPEIVINHHGYADTEKRKEKNARNIKLLKALPDDDPYKWLYLGRAYLQDGGPVVALRCFEEILNTYKNDPSGQSFETWTSELNYLRGRCHLELKDYQSALINFGFSKKIDARFFEAQTKMEADDPGDLQAYMDFTKESPVPDDFIFGTCWKRLRKHALNLICTYWRSTYKAECGGGDAKPAAAG